MNAYVKKMVADEKRLSNALFTGAFALMVVPFAWAVVRMYL